MPYSVKEIFYTLQGEGAHAGRPAVFCRFTGCNLWSGREQDHGSAARARSRARIVVRAERHREDLEPAAALARERRELGERARAGLERLGADRIGAQEAGHEHRPGMVMGASDATGRAMVDDPDCGPL